MLESVIVMSFLSLLIEAFIHTTGINTQISNVLLESWSTSSVSFNITIPSDNPFTLDTESTLVVAFQTI